MIVEYKGVNITGSVTVDKCWLDQYAEEHGDTIQIRFKDTSRLWDGWSPQIGDQIRVYTDHADSGVQYIRSLSPSAGRYEIKAGSIPVSADAVRNAGWQQVTKLQIAKDIAERHGLTFKGFGLTDHKLLYLRQESESDLEFFQKICLLEGDAFLIYDGAFILYNEEYLEGQTPVQTASITANNKLEYLTEAAYTAIEIRNGETSFTYGSDETRKKSLSLSTYIDSKGTAERYAKNLLHHLNKKARSGTFYVSPIADGYTAGSVVNLSTEGAASFDGSAFIYHVRHDLAENKTKVFFRCL